MHCTRADASIIKFQQTRARSGIRKFKEAWIEFEDKAVAKRVALSFHLQPVGKLSKGYRFARTLWMIKYLSGFKWSQLRESEAHEQAMRKKMLEASMWQSQKMNSEYHRSVEGRSFSDKNKKIFEQKKVRVDKDKQTQSAQLSIFNKNDDAPDDFFIK